jgi:peptidoglycan/LPS O-acetylase OafA/YrhL
MLANHGDYFRQLDFLRAISVCMVIFSHWAGFHQYLWDENVFWFNGEIGVKIFFVISGFLITSILLNERERAEQDMSSRIYSLKTFYIRRFLRIFPIYYLTLFATYAIGHPDVVQSIAWHVTYLSNFFFALRGDYLGDVSHFWSLAVEEQFYLAWPFAIFFIPRKYLFAFMLICVASAPVVRYMAMFVLNWNDVTSSVLPFASLDCLAGGGILALIRSNTFPGIDKNMWLSRLKIIGLVCGLLFISLHFVSVPDDQVWYLIFLWRLILVPALIALVLLFVHGFRGVTQRLVELPPLLYMGKISYGIYIFHFFVPSATAWICNELQVTLSPVLLLLINIVILLVLSSMSWHIFEKPINDLKKYFDYSPGPKISWPVWFVSRVAK